MTKYINRELNIGLVNWKEAWLLTRPYHQQLVTENYRGALVFRIQGTSKRIAYKKLKQRLIPARVAIIEESLPF